MGKFAKLARLALAAAVLAGVSGVASAKPYTFEFQLPDWTAESSTALFGDDATLYITVNNGKTTDDNQHYSNSQITGITIDADGGSFTGTWDDLFVGGANSYMSTNSHGLATLDLLASYNESATVFYNPTNGMWLELGVTGSDGGPPSLEIGKGAAILAVIDPAKGGDDDNNRYDRDDDDHLRFTGFEVTGEDPPGNVPEPMSALLVGVGLVGLAAAKRKA